MMLAFVMSLGAVIPAGAIEAFVRNVPAILSEFLALFRSAPLYPRWSALGAGCASDRR
jgi:hypothetical protein